RLPSRGLFVRALGLVDSSRVFHSFQRGRTGKFPAGEGKELLAAIGRGPPQQGRDGAGPHRLSPWTAARIGSLGWGLFLLGLALFVSNPARAQISPGPLAQ